MKSHLEFTIDPDLQINGLRTGNHVDGVITAVITYYSSDAQEVEEEEVHSKWHIDQQKSVDRIGEEEEEELSLYKLIISCF